MPRLAHPRRQSNIRPSRLKHALPLAVAGVALASLAGHARAADLTWNQPSTGLFFFDDPANWNPAQVPTLADDVFFTADANYSLLLTNGTSLARNVSVSAGEVTFAGGTGAFLEADGLVLVDDPSASTLLDGPLAVFNRAQLEALVSQGGTLGGNSIRIGQDGAGRLLVTNQSAVRHIGTYIGVNAGSFGEVIVEGAGTTWGQLNVSNQLIVGNGGTGSYTLRNGATAVSSGFVVGREAGGVGTVNLTGQGTQYRGEIALELGGAGTGNLLVADGAYLQIANLDAAGNIIFNSSSNEVRFGQLSGATGTGLVSGIGSAAGTQTRVFVGFETEVGVAGTGALTVNNGATWDSDRATRIGMDSTAVGTLNVDGIGTRYNVGRVGESLDDLFLGESGRGQVNVTGGARLFVEDNLFVGFNTFGGDTRTPGDNKLVVSGVADDGGTPVASLALVQDALNIGYNGPGSAQVLAGGRAQAQFLRVGDLANGDGVLRIDGAGSIIDASVGTGDTIVAFQGTGTLEITDGGRLTTNEMWIGFRDNSVGTVIVDGPGSVLEASEDNAGNLIVGGDTAAAGGTGTLIVRNGGRVFDPLVNEIFIGGNATSRGLVTVTGPGSLFSADDGGANDTIRLGWHGRGEMEVLDGGEVRAERIVLGNLANADPNAVAALRVSGTNAGTPSLVTTNGLFYIGEGRGGTVTIEDGGVVEVAQDVPGELLLIGLQTGANGASATVDGAGSRLSYRGTGYVSVGYRGGSDAAPSLLSITNGGTFEAPTANVIVADVDAARGTVVVRDPGSSFMSDSLLVGDGTAGAVGRMNVLDGGTAMVTTNAQFGSAGNGRGFLTVSGAGSTFTTGGYLSLGDDIPVDGPARGDLIITAGGRIETGANAHIGRYTGTTGFATVGSSTADVSEWVVDGQMTMAGTETSASTDGSGTLNVLTGGRVVVGDIIRAWDRSTINLNGGELAMRNLLLTDTATAGAPAFNFNTGTLRYTDSAGKTFDAAELDRVLGTSRTIGTGRTLAVENTITLTAPARLNGGTLDVGVLPAGSRANLDFDAGTLSLRQQAVTVDAGGLFGSTLALAPGQQLQVDAGITVAPAGVLAATGTTLGTDAGITNNGNLVLTASTVNGPVVTPAGSAVTVVGGVTFNGPVSGAGNFFGPGTSTFAGGYAPGDSIATVLHEGSLTLTAGGRLEIESDGTSADRVDVLGTLTAAGTLAVSGYAGGIPVPGQTYEILTHGERVGMFDAVANETGRIGLDLQLQYEADAVLLVVDALIDGDANLDAVVNLADFNLLAINFGQSGRNWLQGDFNGDGLVNLEDFNILAVNFGLSAVPAVTSSDWDTLQAAARDASVPEPASLATLGLGLGLLARRRR